MKMTLTFDAFSALSRKQISKLLAKGFILTVTR